jgi:hypothetical protein
VSTFANIKPGYFGPIAGGHKLPPLASFLDALDEIATDPEARRVALQILEENPEGLGRGIRNYIDATDELRSIKYLLTK